MSSRSRAHLTRENFPHSSQLKTNEDCLVALNTMMAGSRTLLSFRVTPLVILLAVDAKPAAEGKSQRNSIPP